jgi:hypothetical protein
MDATAVALPRRSNLMVLAGVRMRNDENCFANNLMSTWKQSGTTENHN